MTRHLASCEQRTLMQGERESRQKAKKIKALHLVVEGYRLPGDGCARSHEYGEEMLLPLVNLPRAGVCGYPGQDPTYS
jgi:hypothetical protein